MMDKPATDKKATEGTPSSPDVMASPSILLVKAVSNLLFDYGRPILPIDLAQGKKKEERQSLEQQKAALVKQLVESKIDPQLFDSLLSNEIDRRLKTRFGVAFVTITVFFTAASYLVVVLNAICKWGISEVAISALIIQAPIQLIGLLFIIARNLFPMRDGDKGKSDHQPEQTRMAAVSTS